MENQEQIDENLGISPESDDPSVELESANLSGTSESDTSPEPPHNSVQAEPQDQEMREVLPDQDWDSLAIFSLDFQVRQSGEGREHQVIVESMESGQEKVWTKVDDEGIYAWILEQIEELGELHTEESAAVSKPSIEITQIEFLQPARVSAGIMVNPTHTIPSSVLISNEPVALEVSLTIVGFNMPDLVEQNLTYQIQGKFHNRLTGIDIPVQSDVTSGLIADQCAYTVRLPEVRLSPGSYRLQMAATLHHPSISPTVFDVPILQVV